MKAKSTQEIVNMPLIDKLLWLWNDLEKAWVQMHLYCAYSCIKNWPSRYTHFLEIDELQAPII